MGKKALLLQNKLNFSLAVSWLHQIYITLSHKDVGMYMSTKEKPFKKKNKTEKHTAPLWARVKVQWFQIIKCLNFMHQSIPPAPSPHTSPPPSPPPPGCSSPGEAGSGAGGIDWCIIGNALNVRTAVTVLICIICSTYSMIFFNWFFVFFCGYTIIANALKSIQNLVFH